MVKRSSRLKIQRQAETLLGRYTNQQIQSGVGLDEDAWQVLVDLYLVIGSLSGSDMWRTDDTGINLRRTALVEIKRLEEIARDHDDGSLASNIGDIARLLSLAASE